MIFFVRLKRKYARTAFITVFLGLLCLLNTNSSFAEQKSISGLTIADPDCEIYDVECLPKKTIDCDFEPWECGEPLPEPECEFHDIDCDPPYPEPDIHPLYRNDYND